MPVMAGSLCSKSLDSGFYLSGRGAARAEDAQTTPTESHVSPSILVYEDHQVVLSRSVPTTKSEAIEDSTQTPSPFTLLTRTRAQNA